MENASKALYMAGGILIAIVIASIMVYIFYRGSLLSYEFDSKLSDEELQAYNAEFEKYVNKETILAQDIISIINRAHSINQKNEDEGGSDFISVEVAIDKNRTYIFDSKTDVGKMYKKNNKTETISWDEFLNKYSQTGLKDNKTKIYYKDSYKLDENGISYYSNGKIKSLNFVHITIMYEETSNTPTYWEMKNIANHI